MTLIARMLKWLRAVKDAAEWYGIIGGLLGLPTAAVVVAVVNGFPVDIVLLYVSFLIAYTFVIVSIGRPIIADWMERRTPRLRIGFHPDCVDCHGEHTGSWDMPAHHVAVAIENPTGRQAQNVIMHLHELDGRRMRRAFDADPRTLNPSKRHYHMQLILQDSRQHPPHLQVIGGDGLPIVLAPGDHALIISVESANLPPTEARIEFRTGSHGWTPDTLRVTM